MSRHSQSFIELIEQLENAPRLKLVELVTLLLQWCRDHSEAVRNGENLGHLARTRSNLRKGFAEVLDRHQGSIFHGSALRDLCQVARSASSSVEPQFQPLAEGCAVRSLALVIETDRGHLVWTHFRSLGDTSIAAGEFVPFISPIRKGSPLFKAYGKRLGTRPSSVTRRVDVLVDNGGLLPDHGYAVRLCTGFDALDALDASSTVACVFPSDSSCLTSPEAYMREEELYFFGVQPADPKAQTAAALDLVQRVDSEGAAILVMPEVSLDPVGTQVVTQWLQRHARSLLVAVCGTHHRGNGPGDNIASVAVPRQNRVVEHRKIMRFRRHDGALEDLCCLQSEMVVCCSDSWSLAVPICKDFLDGEIQNLLDAARVALVLVPACSPRTSDFAAAVAHHSVRSQAHVVVANSCEHEASERPAAALIGRPVCGGMSDVLEEFQRFSVEIPGFTLHKLV